MHIGKTAILKTALCACTVLMLFALLAEMGPGMPQKVRAQTETGALTLAPATPSASVQASQMTPAPSFSSVHSFPREALSIDKLFRPGLPGFTVKSTLSNGGQYSASVPAPGAITGKVTDNSGVPLSGISVSASDYSSNNLVKSAQTDAFGVYTLSDLIPGNYRVDAVATEYALTWYPNTLNGDQSLPVTVKAGKKTLKIDFKLQPGGTISGTVKDTANNPLSAISVIAMNPQKGWQRGGITNASGEYRIEGIPYETYKVYAPGGSAASDQDYARQYHSGAVSFDQAEDVPVSATQNPAAVNFSLETGGSILGHVFESIGGAPIQDATVGVFEFDSEQFVKKVQSDTDGSYSIPGLAGGNYYVVAWADGHAVNWYKAALWSTLSEPVSVITPEDTPNIDFNLGPGGTISGNIKFGSANLFDVSITALSADYPYGWATTTDALGNYTLRGLPYGTYKLFAPAGIGSGDNPYAMQFNKNTMDSAKAAAIVVSATTPALVKKDFKLVKGGSITGTITNSQDVPMEGAWVEASEYTSNLYIKGTHSAADGTFTLAGMATGKFKVNAWAEGYVRLWYNNSAYSSQASAVAVTLPKTTANISFKLATGGTISGSVTSSGGKALQRVSVVALGRGVNGGGGALSDKYGNYTIEGLPFGDYLVASPWGFGPGDADYAREYYNHQGTQPLADTVSTTSSAPEVEDIDFTLSTGGSIRGHVYEVTGTAPLVGATVTVRDYNTGSFIKSGLTAADGSYSINGLPSDSYRVEAWKSGRVRLWYALPDNTFWYGQAGQVEVVKPEDITGIDFKLDLGGSISGNIKSGKTNLANVSVNASPAGNTAVGASALTDSSGNFTVTGLPFGSYLLSAPAGFGSGDSNYIKVYYDKAATTAKAKTIVLTQQAAAVKSKNFILTMGGSISGFVYQSEGSQPLQEAKVMAFAPNTLEPAGSTLTGSDGTFVIHGLAGSYYVTAFKAEYERRWNPNKVLRSEAQPVTVVANNNVSVSDFELNPGGSISGKVTFEGTGLARVGVAAMSPGYPPTLEWIEYTDSQGFYTISSLAYGGYLIHAPSTAGSAYNSYIKKYYRDSIYSASASPVTIPDLVTKKITKIADINITLSPGAPQVVENYPTDDYYNAPRDSAIKIVFDKSMSQSATQSAFSITPKAAGKFSWNYEDGSILSFAPSPPLAPNTKYTVKITANKTRDLLKPAGSIPSDYIFHFTTINAAGDASIPVTIEAPPTALQNGTFSVKIKVKNVNRLVGYGFELNYDPGVINVTGANPGLFSSGPFANPGWSFYQTGSQGSIKVIAYFSQLSGPTYVNGEGDLVELLFKAVGSIGQSSQMHLFNFSLSDVEGNAPPVKLPEQDATITITSTP